MASLDPLLPQSPSVGDPVRRPLLDACMVHRSDKINAAELALERALVIVVGGAHPPVSTAYVRLWLRDLYGGPSSNITVHRFHPEDFLISFSSLNDMFRVLHHPPPNPLFALVLKRWHRQLMASVDNLLFHVSIALCGLPPHAWQLSIAHQLLSIACANLQATPTTLAKSDLHRFIVTTRCIHPDMIPREKLLYIPEPEFAHVWGPPLFVNPEEFIHHSQPTLFYRVGFDVLEVEDWHVPSDSSSSDGGSDSGGDGLPSGHGGFS
jgi:hypothetical protein